MSSFTRQQLEDYLKTIVLPPRSNVLDIGGSQLPIINRIKQENILSADVSILDLEKPHECKQKPDIVCDLNEEIIHGSWCLIDEGLVKSGHCDYNFDKSSYELHYQSKGFLLPEDYKKHYELIEIEPINDDELWELKKYDIAFCMEVSEYWYDPMTALKNINEFLKQGGILYISFSFIYPVHNPSDQDYLRYTENGARKLLKETGFKVTHFTPRVEKKDFYSFFNVAVANGMRPAKDYHGHNLVGCIIQAEKL